ncbi:hypothetical protein RBU49_15275 [Clostridium sp. MB40-C1]|uniref:hypothetical protein n=1 Tax=Clostridium sp. MB40-C1 TaxID=3070996 RepID=UPI0027E096B7|nr:hypothetical protein [Clostridium sp. MB40-C1]WMJ80165.1 hypothetical protein RBU49_15275 [Clostridium sp. MB40-C1]
MNLNNIDSINTEISKYSMYNNETKAKINETHIAEISNNDDYLELSIDYSNDEVSNVLNSIRDSFEDSYYMHNDNNKSIVDCTSEYGKILKSINSNSKFDDDTKIKLTKALDDSFDSFIEKKVKEFSNNISDFFNKPGYMKEAYDRQGNNMGIKGEKIVNEIGLEKNIKSMFLVAKNFYKNNLNGTKEELDTFLQNRFSETKSVEELSYNDFKSLNKALDIVNDYDQSTSVFKSSKLMNSALENLEKGGVSSKLVNAFKKAINQNNDCSSRIKTFGKIQYEYEKQLEKLMAEGSNNEVMLKELNKKRKKMVEDYNKEMEKFQHQMYKLDMLKLSMSEDVESDNPLENLTKIHNKQLERLDKQQIEIENRINDTRKMFKEVSENYTKFLKEPASFIDSELKNKI